MLEFYSSGSQIFFLFLPYLQVFSFSICLAVEWNFKPPREKHLVFMPPYLRSMDRSLKSTTSTAKYSMCHFLVSAAHFCKYLRLRLLISRNYQVYSYKCTWYLDLLFIRSCCDNIFSAVEEQRKGKKIQKNILKYFSLSDGLYVYIYIYNCKRDLFLWKSCVLHFCCISCFQHSSGASFWFVTSYILPWISPSSKLLMIVIHASTITQFINHISQWVKLFLPLIQ